MKPNRDELTERYATFATDRLLEMLDNRREYTIEAVEVLQAELAKRKIGENEIQHYIAALGIQHAETKRIAAVPLTFWEKVFFFFVWFSPGFISVALGMNYWKDGYATKLRQGRFFRMAGFLFLMLTGFLSILTGFGEISGIILLIVLFGITFWAEKSVKWNLTKTDLNN